MSRNLPKVLLIIGLLTLLPSNLWAEEDIGTLVNEGISLYRQRRYPEAKIALEKVVLIKKEPDLFYLLGNTYYMLGGFEKSEDAYMEALKVDPNYMPALKNLGRLLYQERKYIESIAVFDRVLAKNPGDVEAIRFQAGSYHDLDNIPKAIEKFEQIHRLNPDIQRQLCFIRDWCLSNQIRLAITYLWQWPMLNLARGTRPLMYYDRATKVSRMISTWPYLSLIYFF
jgi:tetratricopeptide (TPR) repeat protein